MDYSRLVSPYLEKQMTLATLLPLRRLCRRAEVSRAGFYRWRSERSTPDADMDRRDLIQRLALDFSCYGSRRILHKLRRRGQIVNRKRMQRLMREDNLLCLRKRRCVTTTDSAHGLPVSPNLARDMTLTVAYSTVSYQFAVKRRVIRQP